MIFPKLIDGCELNLDDYFVMDDKTYSGIIIYDFKDDKIDDFIASVLIPFRRCYVSDDDLNYEVGMGINTREEAIESKLPTLPMLKSGEFAEILMYYICCHAIAPDANVIPIKWHWKEHRDMACHLTDLALFKIIDHNNPSKEDYFFSMEVKAGATPLGEKSTKTRMREAIDGAMDDITSRMAKLIPYLTTKYAKERNAQAARMVKRFADSVTVPFIRRVNAAIVVERASLKKHIENIPAEYIKNARINRIALFAVPMTGLKKIYERVYAQTPLKG